MEVKKPEGVIAPKQLRVCAMLNARNIPSCIVDNVTSGKGFIDAWLDIQKCPGLVLNDTLSEELLIMPGET